MLTPRTRLASASLILVLVVVSFMFSAQNVRAQTSDVIVIGKSQDMSTWDPQARNVITTTEIVLSNIYDTLVSRDQQLQPKPGLARSWRMVDPNTWEFQLRRGVRFHNGERFDANAVKFSFERGLDPKTGWVRASLLRLIKSVVVVDDFTVRVVTERPWPLLIPIIARYGWIVPPGYVRQNGDAALARQPIGTGPYKFVRWVKDDRTELEANTNYWGGKPSIARVIIRVIPTESTRLAELLAGSVHLINTVEPEIFGPIERSPRAKLVNASSTRILYIRFNLVNIAQGRPFADKRVRQAINYAIDRNNLIQVIMRNAVSPVATICVETDIGCDKSIPPFPYDPERARTLLTEAGFPNGFDFSISTTTGGAYPGDEDIPFAIADQLRRVGIRTRIVPIEFGIHTQRLLDKKVQEDSIYIGVTGGLGWAGDKAQVVFNSKGRATLWVPGNREFDQLLNDAEVATEESRMKELLRRAQLIFKEEAPGIPLFTAPNANGLNRDLDWQPVVDGTLNMFTASWKQR